MTADGQVLNDIILNNVFIHILVKLMILDLNQFCRIMCIILIENGLSIRTTYIKVCV